MKKTIVFLILMLIMAFVLVMCKDSFEEEQMMMSMLSPEEIEEILAAGGDTSQPAPLVDTCTVINPVDTTGFIGGHAHSIKSFKRLEKVWLRKFAGYNCYLTLWQNGNVVATAADIEDRVSTLLDSKGITYDTVAVMFHLDYTDDVITTSLHFYIPGTDLSLSTSQYTVMAKSVTGYYHGLVAGNLGWGEGYWYNHVQYDYDGVRSWFDMIDSGVYAFSFVNTNLNEDQAEDFAALILENCYGYGRRADWQSTDLTDSTFQIFVDREWQVTVQ